jgi:hypothetical protein
MAQHDRRRGDGATDAEARPTVASAPRVGWVAGQSASGALLVDFEGNALGPLEATSTVALDARAAAEAARRRQGAVLLFAEGDAARPILVGLVQPPPPSMIDLVLDPAASDGADAAGGVDAVVDGRRVVIEGKDEVVLRCGAASITLTANGKVVIRGEQVETHAAGTNRIKGGSVRIN